MDFQPVLSSSLFLSPPLASSSPLSSKPPNGSLFFFWGGRGGSEILKFDLHFVFVLGLDCDDSWLKDGVLKRVFHVMIHRL